MRGKRAKRRLHKQLVAACEEYLRQPCPACNHPLGKHSGGVCTQYFRGEKLPSCSDCEKDLMIYGRFYLVRERQPFLPSPPHQETNTR